MTNTLYPGRENYSGPTEGLYLLLHHDQLCEWSHDVNERLEYIRTKKPSYEVATRLYNICYLVPREDMPWIAECVRLRAESDRLRAESDRLRAESRRLRAESDRLRAESRRLWAESDRLLAEGRRLLVEHTDELLAELMRLVPDTAWNEKAGHMFFNK